MNPNSSRPRPAHLEPDHELPGDASLREWSEQIPHDCIGEDEPAPERTRSTPSAPRLVGLDAARGIALIGMVAVHTISANNEAGNVSLAWALSSGKSSALFAVLGGVGLAFMSGRQRPVRGASWGRVILRQLIRALVIATIGFLLGSLVPSADVSIILPYLGVMFAIGSLFTPLGARWLIGLGLTWALASPFLSMYLRIDLALPPTHNLTFGSLLADPSGSALLLFLTGYFPVITWMSYLFIGMGLGRMDLGSRRTVARLLVGGVVTTVVAWGATLVLIDQVDVRSRIASDVMGTMSLDTFTEYLVFGGDGTLPADSWWWLGINAPHTGTTLDLLYTAGIAVTVIGLCLGISHVTGASMALLAVPGSMTLTLYSMHLLLVEWLGDLPDSAHFAIQTVILVSFALIWHRFFKRGPLEGPLAWLTRTLVPNPRPRVKPVSAAAQRWEQ